jgi:hypothetical protein
MLLNMTFGVEEQGLFDDDFLSMRRGDVSAMMNHAFNSYLMHGFPADEVRPITCVPHNMFLADGGGNGVYASVEWQLFRDLVHQLKFLRVVIRSVFLKTSKRSFSSLSSLMRRRQHDSYRFSRHTGTGIFALLFCLRRQSLYFSRQFLRRRQRVRSHSSFHTAPLLAFYSANLSHQVCF